MTVSPWNIPNVISMSRRICFTNFFWHNRWYNSSEFLTTHIRTSITDILWWLLVLTSSASCFQTLSFSSSSSISRCGTRPYTPLVSTNRPYTQWYFNTPSLVEAHSLNLQLHQSTATGGCINALSPLFIVCLSACYKKNWLAIFVHSLVSWLSRK